MIAVPAEQIETPSTFDEYASTLTPEDLAQLVRISWFPDPPCIITVAGALVQVVWKEKPGPVWHRS